jgi:hypothetical protein
MLAPGPRPFATLLLPSGAALLWMIAALVAPDAPAAGAAVVAPALGVLPLAFVAALIWARRPERAEVRPLVALGPCLLAPLAIIAPWAVVPSRLGPAHAGLRFFVAGLSQGPVHVEILLGLCGVLLSAALPAAFAAHALAAREPSARALRLLALGQLVAYVPVLLRLDAVTLWHAAATLARGRVVEAASTGSGALLRALATGCMVGWVSRERPKASAAARRRRRQA